MPRSTARRLSLVAQRALQVSRPAHADGNAYPTEPPRAFNMSIWLTYLFFWRDVLFGRGAC